MAASFAAVAKVLSKLRLWRLLCANTEQSAFIHGAVCVSRYVCWYGGYKIKVSVRVCYGMNESRLKNKKNRIFNENSRIICLKNNLSIDKIMVILYNGFSNKERGWYIKFTREELYMQKKISVF